MPITQENKRNKETYRTHLYEKADLDRPDLDFVDFEVQEECGNRYVKRYGLDTIMKEEPFGYFYGLACDVLTWGFCGREDGDCYTFHLISSPGLLRQYCVEDERFDEDMYQFYLNNPGMLASMVTEKLIQDPDTFESFTRLLSYDDIYRIRPLMGQLHEDLKEFFQTLEWEENPRQLRFC